MTAPQTYLTISDDRDLNQIFEYNNGNLSTQADKTYYTIPDGKDLNEIFSPYRETLAQSNSLNADTNNGNWSSIAGDITGQYLVASLASTSIGGIYRSTDYGINWTKIYSNNLNWTKVISDDTGEYLAACVNGGYIYTSIDSGVNWTYQTSAGSREWFSMTCDSTGQQIIACLYNSNVAYKSINGGKDWNPSGAISVTGIWINLASSGDGKTIVAAVNYTVYPNFNHYIYISYNSSDTWDQQLNSYNYFWTGVTVARNNPSIIGVCNSDNNTVFITIDAGVTWNNYTCGSTISTNYSFGMASSSDGSKMVICKSGEAVYLSSNTGQLWNTVDGSDGSSALLWTGVYLSSDGTKMATFPQPGYIYYYPYSKAPITHYVMPDGRDLNEVFQQK